MNRSRRLVHFNVTAHPTSAWTLQQLREVMGFENRYQYLLHDRVPGVDSTLHETSHNAVEVDATITKATPNLARLNLPATAWPPARARCSSPLAFAR
jgi:hypothetical protein